MTIFTLVKLVPNNVNITKVEVLASMKDFRDMLDEDRPSSFYSETSDSRKVISFLLDQCPARMSIKSNFSEEATVIHCHDETGRIIMIIRPEVATTTVEKKKEVKTTSLLDGDEENITEVVTKSKKEKNV